MARFCMRMREVSLNMKVRRNVCCLLFAIRLTIFSDTWYWFGQNEEEGKPLFSGMSLYFHGCKHLLTICIQGITVYSSKDLVNWKNEGIALAPVNGTEIGSEQVVERPKVVYNEPTKTWVVSNLIEWTQISRPTLFRCGSMRTTARTAS